MHPASPNPAGVVANAIGALDPLTEEGLAVLILHHAGWEAKRSRGSTDIVGAVETCFYLESAEEARTLECLGTRHDSIERLSYRLGEGGVLESLGSQRAGSASKTSLAVAAVERLNRPAPSEEVAEKLRWKVPTAHKFLRRAWSAKLLARDIVESGRYVWRKRSKYET
jgi:hypothetical protein